MRTRCFFVLFVVVWITGQFGCAAGVGADHRQGPHMPAHAMVATVHPLATDAGLAMLKAGGNAVDAAVAAALTLGVVDGFNSGIGGGCFILLRTANGRLIAIDGRETAPAHATRDMFLRDGKPRPELSQTGPLAVGTPGALAAYDRAVARHGRLPLRTHLQHAAAIARDGFIVDEVYASRLASTAGKIRRFEGAAAVLLKPDGRPHAAGDELRQPDLAATYELIAAQGTDAFYRGPIAERIGAWMAEHGGILTADDFAAYEPLDRQPIVSRYREHTIVGFPPPSSGGVHVAQMLNVLEHFDLAALHRQGDGSAEHVVAEAMKRAFADRAYWLGDPAYADVPRGLISEAYATELARQIDPQRATEVAGHGTPEDLSPFSTSIRESSDREALRHTTHIAAADSEGNWVAITATINTTFGSGIIVPGTGIVLNNEMDDFSAAPGQPNFFGLIGTEANAVAPGKRPLSSMSPTIVLRNGRPVLTVGAAGGPRIITQALQTILRTIDYGQELPEAVAAGRIHHQWRPDVLYVEDSVPGDVRQSLRDRGHRVQNMGSAGVTQAILWDEQAGRFIGVADPRVNGKAKGF